MGEFYMLMNNKDKTIEKSLIFDGSKPGCRFPKKRSILIENFQTLSVDLDSLQMSVCDAQKVVSKFPSTYLILC